MDIKTVTTKIVGYDAAQKVIFITVKTDLCQKPISEYLPVAIPLATVKPAYSIEAAVKEAIRASYMNLIARHQEESKETEFFNQLASDVQSLIEVEQTFVVGVDIAADVRRDLQDESSVPTTLESSVRVV
jgi:hypothetical protein